MSSSNEREISCTENRKAPFPSGTGQPGGGGRCIGRRSAEQRNGFGGHTLTVETEELLALLQVSVEGHRPQVDHGLPKEPPPE